MSSKSAVWKWKQAPRPPKLVVRKCPCPCGREFVVDANKHPQRLKRYYDSHRCCTRLLRKNGYKDKSYPHRQEVLAMPEREAGMPTVEALVRGG